MENLLFLGVPILKHIRVFSSEVIQAHHSHMGLCLEGKNLLPGRSKFFKSNFNFQGIGLALLK